MSREDSGSSDRAVAQAVRRPAGNDRAMWIALAFCTLGCTMLLVVWGSVLALFGDGGIRVVGGLVAFTAPWVGGRGMLGLLRKVYA